MEIKGITPSALRKLPIGIQSFEKLRREGYLYVDKTALVYQLATTGAPYFPPVLAASERACC